MHNWGTFAFHLIRSLIRNLFDKLFLFYWFCWFFVRYTRVREIPVPLVNNWLTDLVFMPIVIHFAFILANTVLSRSMPVGFSFKSILLACLLTSVCYEAILPMTFLTTRSDFVDVVAYFTGGIFYFFFHQPRAVKNWGQ